MQKATDLPQSKLSHFKIRLNIPDVCTVFVFEQHIRAVSALSVLPTYSLCNFRTLCVLSPKYLRGLRPLKCHPYVRDVCTLTILRPLLSAGNLDQFVHPLLHP